MIYAFSPVCGETPRILILGSMPSVKSLEEKMYYGHPRNQFWPIIFTLLGEEVSGVHTEIAYDDKLEKLRCSGIALWDVYKECDRDGSLDANIVNGQYNDLSGFVNTHPSLRLIVFNGGKAAEALKKNKSLAQILKLKGIETRIMPSTSPAYTLGFEKKLEAWREIIDFL